MPPKEHRTTVEASSGGYDQSLIAQAPDITKSDRQEGYDINLVEQSRKTPFSPPDGPLTRTTNPPAVPPASGSHSSLEKSAVTPQSASNAYSNNFTKSKSTPWYRTTKGLAIMIIVAFVVVGVIVGVAVGVTQSKKTPNQVTAGVAGVAGATGAIATQGAVSTQGGTAGNDDVPSAGGGNVPVPSGTRVT